MQRRTDYHGIPEPQAHQAACPHRPCAWTPPRIPLWRTPQESSRIGQRALQFAGCVTCLGRMSLVNDDSEPLAAVRTSLYITGNFWSVVMMMPARPLSPHAAAVHSCLSSAPHPQRGQLIDGVCSWLSSTLRSVTMMTDWKIFSSWSSCRPVSRWASQAMELDLPEPALC